MLPEAHSNLGKGFKVVSFYVDPAALLERAYVLRRDGWRDNTNLYQRMVSAKKIEQIRKYLYEEKRVFVNNILVTLTSEVKLLDNKDNVCKLEEIQKTSPIQVQLPMRYNSIGIIDGQHRVFTYHEGGSHDPEIGILRKQQNLLATGIIYPEFIKDIDQEKFEARLFLEINSNQTRAKSDLKQAIGLILHPYDQESIAKQVLNVLNAGPGPLANEFQGYFFEQDKIKTTSVVSYGLRPLVRISKKEGLFRIWPGPGKVKLLAESDSEARSRYIKYCATNINTFFGAVKAVVPQERWTAVKKVPGRMLTTTIVNGLIICLRLTAEAKKTGDFEYYRKKLTKLSQFNFGTYKSSQYTRMGHDLYDTYLKG